MARLRRRRKNPIIESIIGGLGVGAGFAAGATAVKGMMGTKNPIRKSLWSKGVQRIGPVSPEQIMRDMKAYNYTPWGHKNSEEEAAFTANDMSDGKIRGIPRGSDVKVYTIADTNRYMIFYKEKGRP